MLPTAARTLADYLIDHHLPAQGWHFAWNRRKRSLGLCRYREKRIELSLHFVLANDEAQVRETILHEIAHALAGEKAGHGPAWKNMCGIVGCKPERCDKGQAVMPMGRWSAQCPACGKQYSRHKRPHRRARYWCRNCGPEKGAVVFDAVSLS
jgi:predicted SprT family Zn-dependent metalloprotease